MTRESSTAIKLRLKLSELEQIDAAAQREGIDRSSFIKAVIASHLNSPSAATVIKGLPPAVQSKVTIPVVPSGSVYARPAHHATCTCATCHPPRPAV